MAFNIDLHVHTMMSGDNDSEPESMVLDAIAKGLHGIAFTEHSSYRASSDVDRLRHRYSDRLLILRGVEFSCLEGHCLVFGLDTDRLGLSGASAERLLGEVKKRGGVMIPAHPYRTGSGIGELVRSLDGIHAIECANGANIHPMNVRAARDASALGLPCVGGSDAHGPGEVGKCYTEFDSEVTHDNFIERLTSGRYRAHDIRKISRMDWLITD